MNNCLPYVFCVDIRVSGSTDVEYSSDTGSHIVAQKFRYRPRDKEAQQVVECMKRRQLARAKNVLRAYDKILNPLIAVPGSPGIGKSTFLAHFPESEAYKTYLGPNHSAIVSTFTFNSGMRRLSCGEDCLGLRILYGAAVGMGLQGCEDLGYVEFATRFPLYSLDVHDAIYILQDVFGSHRRILLLVDELQEVYVTTGGSSWRPWLL